MSGVQRLRTPAHMGLRRTPTRLALIGVIIATAVLTFIASVTYGQDKYLRKWLLYVTPHATVLPERTAPLVPHRLFNIGNAVVELIVNTPPADRREVKPRVEIATRARRSSKSIKSIAPFVLLHGIVRNGSRYRAVEIRGVDPALERGVDARTPREHNFAERLRSAPNATLIGSGLAARLQVRLGDRLALITGAGVIRQLEVVKIFKTDVLALDHERAYVNLELAQSLRGMPRNAVTGFAIEAHRSEFADRVASSVERAIGFRTVTWARTNADLLRAHRSSITMTLLVAGALVAISALALSNALLATVLLPVTISPSNGSRANAKSLAAHLKRGMLLGGIGGALGASLGYLVVLLIKRSGWIAPSFVSQHIRFGATPVSFDPIVFIIPAVVAFVLVGTASLIPYWRAMPRRARTIIDSGQTI